MPTVTPHTTVAFAPMVAPHPTSVKARVLSPITRVPAGAHDEDPLAVVGRYNLRPKFFCLPNQFWSHKNHELVFAAVRDLKAAGTSVTVVCTGYPNDYATPAIPLRSGITSPAGTSASRSSTSAWSPTKTCCG